MGRKANGDALPVSSKVTGVPHALAGAALSLAPLASDWLRGLMSGTAPTAAPDRTASHAHVRACASSAASS
jgi:hypothetical protein